MSSPLLLLLYLAGVLNYGTGTLPFGEPCQIRNPNPYEWHAFVWDKDRHLTRVEWLTGGELRERSVLSWSGGKLDRIELDQSEPFSGPDFLFTLSWSGGFPTRMVRENAPGGQVTGGRIVWSFEWTKDHRSVRVTENWGAGPPRVRTATFDERGRLVTVSMTDPNDRFRAELIWSANGRLGEQRTYYGSHTFTYDDKGRIATRAILTGVEHYLYDCPTR